MIDIKTLIMQSADWERAQEKEKKWDRLLDSGANFSAMLSAFEC